MELLVPIQKFAGYNDRVTIRSRVGNVYKSFITATSGLTVSTDKDEYNIPPTNADENILMTVKFADDTPLGTNSSVVVDAGARNGPLYLQFNVKEKGTVPATTNPAYMNLSVTEEISSRYSSPGNYVVSKFLVRTNLPGVPQGSTLTKPLKYAKWYVDGVYKTDAEIIGGTVVPYLYRVSKDNPANADGNSPRGYYEIALLVEYLDGHVENPKLLIPILYTAPPTTKAPDYTYSIRVDYELAPPDEQDDNFRYVAYTIHDGVATTNSGSTVKSMLLNVPGQGTVGIYSGFTLYLDFNSPPITLTATAEFYDGGKASYSFVIDPTTYRPENIGNNITPVSATFGIMGYVYDDITIQRFSSFTDSSGVLTLSQLGDLQSVVPPISSIASNLLFQPYVVPPGYTIDTVELRMEVKSQTYIKRLDTVLDYNFTQVASPGKYTVDVFKNQDVSTIPGYFRNTYIYMTKVGSLPLRNVAISPTPVSMTVDNVGLVVTPLTNITSNELRNGLSLSVVGSPYYALDTTGRYFTDISSGTISSGSNIKVVPSTLKLVVKLKTSSGTGPIYTPGTPGTPSTQPVVPPTYTE